MPNITLTEARVRALRPRKTAYDIRDGKLTGFGLHKFASAKHSSYSNNNLLIIWSSTRLLREMQVASVPVRFLP